MTKTVEELTAEVERLKRLIAPVAIWWNYVEMRAEIAEQTIKDTSITLQCMHSGGSVGVTVGELRALTNHWTDLSVD